MIDQLIVTILLAAAAPPNQTSAALLAFPGTGSYGLHACDPAVPPPADSYVFCASARGKNRKHRDIGDGIKGCLGSGLKFRTNGPPLEPATELSFLVTRGTVGDLACELGKILEVPVTTDAEVGTLSLKQVHWRGLFEDGVNQPFETENGTTVYLRIDFERNTIALVRGGGQDDRK